MASDQSLVDTHTDCVARLVFLCRVRAQIQQAKLRCGNQIAAMERLQTGKVKDGSRQAVRVPTMDDIAVAITAKGHLTPAMKIFEKQLKAQDKEITAVARELPVWPWVDSVRGFGALGLGLIVGACGDLLKYSNPAKVWKRLGLAVIRGERQRRVSDADLAAEHGYNPRRRALMYVIGASLLKQNGERGEYRCLYDGRKAHTLVTHPEWTKLHRHNDALRYMEKRLLRDLWQAWHHAAEDEVTPNRKLPRDAPSRDGQSADDTQPLCAVPDTVGDHVTPDTHLLRVAPLADHIDRVPQKPPVGHSLTCR